MIIIIDNSKSQWTQGPTQCCPHCSGYPSSRVWALQVRLYKDNCADNDHGDGAGSLYWSLVSILISPVPCVLILNVHSYSSLDSVKWKIFVFGKRVIKNYRPFPYLIICSLYKLLTLHAILFNRGFTNSSAATMSTINLSFHLTKSSRHNLKTWVFQVLVDCVFSVDMELNVLLKCLFVRLHDIVML